MAKRRMARTVKKKTRIKLPRPNWSRMRPVLLSLLLVASMAGLWQGQAWLSRAGLFPVSNIVVKGRFTHLQPRQVYDLLRDRVVGDFFEVPVQVIRDSVQSLPWVAGVSVRRKWPDTVVVWVQEQQPVAYWGDDALLSVEGEVFSPRRVPAGLALPRLAGHSNSEKLVLEKYKLLQQELSAIGQDIARLEIDDRRAWHLHLRDGPLLELGRYADADRVQRYIQLYDNLFAKRIEHIRELDLRYSNGISVRWKDGAAEIAQGTKDVKKS